MVTPPLDLGTYLSVSWKRIARGFDGSCNLVCPEKRARTRNETKKLVSVDPLKETSFLSGRSHLHVVLSVFPFVSEQPKAGMGERADGASMRRVRLLLPWAVLF